MIDTKICCRVSGIHEALLRSVVFGTRLPKQDDRRAQAQSHPK